VNRQIVKLFGLVVVLFAVLIGFTSYWSVFDAKALREKTANKRPLLEQQQIQRGRILAADGTVIARSVAKGHGSGKRYVRRYPEGRLYGHPIGYSFVQFGDSEFERFHNDELVGNESEFGSILDQLRGRNQQGNDIVTNLDPAAQATALADLEAAGYGAVVAIEPKSGRVVAMASNPPYDPNRVPYEFSKLSTNEIETPLLNRATQGQYPPGSTWKVTSVAAAVAAGYSLNGTYACPGGVTIGGHTYQNDGNPSLGPMSFYTALVVSCDTVFYQLAYDIYLHDRVRDDTVTSPRAPVQEMQKMELGWGFGHTTGVDLPEENPGSIPTREWLYYFWKDNAHRGQNWCKHGRANGSYVQQIEYQDCRYGNVWTAGQSVIASIGQGYVSVTPLQLARAYAALANGGTLYSPRIGEALIGPGGKVERAITPPVTGHLPVAKSTLAYIRHALAGVVTSGTAAGTFGGFPLGRVCVAGKTGTAQVQGNQSTSVFASFAPCDHPRFVVVVMIPNSGFGAQVSGPAARQIWDGLFGLEGHKAALPGGALPGLPRLNKAGQVVPPPGFGPKPAKHAKHAKHGTRR
jgi:penicillin-binding protein 2